MKCFYILILLTLAACHEKTTTENTAVTREEIDEFLPQFHQTDTFYIYTRLDDCGEWGGPKDHFALYADSLNQFYIECKRYRFNCDSIGYYYGKEKPLEYKTIIKLDESKKKSFTAFLNDMMEAKISENINSNAGSIYYAHNNDSTLDIKLYTEQKKIKEEFYTFKKSLRLPENRYSNQMEVPLEN